MLVDDVSKTVAIEHFKHFFSTICLLSSFFCVKQESISRNPRCSICLDRLDITVPEEAAGCWLDNQVLVDGVSWGQSLVCSPGRDVLQRGGGDLFNSLHFSIIDFDGVVVLESQHLLTRD